MLMSLVDIMESEASQSEKITRTVLFYLHPMVRIDMVKEKSLPAAHSLTSGLAHSF